MKFNSILQKFMVLAAVHLFLLPAQSCGQISKKLVAFLPDSCRPVPLNKADLTIAEMKKILLYAEGYVTPVVSDELDSMASRLAEKVLANQNDSISIPVLHQLTSYSTTAANFTAATRYCNYLMDKTKGKKKYATLRHSAQKIQGALYASSGNYEESIAYFNVCLQEAKADRDSIGVAEIYSGISYPYAILALYEQTIASLDSSIAWFGTIKENQPYYPEKEDVLVSKCGRYLNLYEITGNPAFGRKAMELIETARTKKKHHYLYDMFPVGYAFLIGDYKRCLFLSDSLLTQIARNAPAHENAMTTYINKYRALIFLATGRQDEGAALLSQLIGFYLRKKGPSGNANANISRLSEKLYIYYKSKGNWKNAVTYLEMSRSYNDSLNLLQNRGHLFELQQKYNFSQQLAQLRVLERNNIIRSKERNQAISAGVISLLFMMIILLLLYNRNRKLEMKRKAAEQEAVMKIDRLRIMSQLQIAELEEKSSMLQQDERRKLGMELHDDLGASLASIQIRLSTCLRKITDPELRAQFEELRQLLKEVYENVREKSHQWFNNENMLTNAVYASKINDLLDTALPHHFRRKDVVIEAECLRYTSLQVKIELLYIIQEAIANILKHAQADSITILIYRDIPGIIMEINDNGRGFNTAGIGNGIGLKSIWNRAESIGGKAEITSCRQGTEVKITIPCSPALAVQANDPSGL